MRESEVRPGDMMAVELARLIHNGDRVFHGVSSHLPMIAVLLAKHTHAPDVSVIHVQEADAFGNARIEGPVYEDALLARASKRTIVTAERIVGDGYFAARREKAQIPGFLVSHVVHCPRGAAPCACAEEYGIDEAAIRAARGEGGRRP